MSNLFSTEKFFMSSKRFMLIRMNPKAMGYVTTITSLGSNLYSFTWENISNVYINVSGGNKLQEFTLVTDTPNADFEYSYVNNVVTMYSTETVNQATIFFSYYLYLTGGESKVTFSDPMNSATNKVEWNPIVSTYPSIEYSIDNLTYGYLTTSSTSIEVINYNSSFNEHLSDYVSFSRRDVKIWMCINSVDNVSPLFIGSITSYNVDYNSIKFKVEDKFSGLNYPAKYNDTKNATYITVADYAGLDPNKDNLPIRIFYGPTSRYGLLPETVTGMTDAKKVDQITLFEAVCSSYTEEILTTTNREWILGRASLGGIDEISTTDAWAISGVDNTSGNYTIFQINNIKDTFSNHIISGITTGSTIALFDGANYRYVRIFKVVNSGANNIVTCSKDAGINNGDYIVSSGVDSVVIINGLDEYIAYDIRDYTIAEYGTVSDAGFYVYKLTFTDNFEATLSMPTLDPGSFQVKFRMRCNTQSAVNDSLVGAVLYKMIAAVGAPVNGTSFDTLDTTLSGTTYCSTIPYFDESDYSDYSKYIADILKSVNSFLYYNEDLEICAKQYAVTSGGTLVDENNIVDDSFTVTVGYKDIKSDIIVYNPAFYADSWLSGGAGGTSNSLNRFLHDAYETTKMVSRVSTITPSYKLTSNRSATYTFKVDSSFYGAKIGDCLTLETKTQLGDITQRDIMITGIVKNINYIEITATDLKELGY